MSIQLEIDRAVAAAVPVPETASWVVAADAVQKYVTHQSGQPAGSHAVVVRIVDETESAALNSEWRGKDYATNVLAFPAPPLMFEGLDEASPLGDLVICAAVVNREAIEQGKTGNDHWTHMLVHGLLHLMGYDHILDDDAHVMEAIEIDVLMQLGIANPY
ncbi:MAG: rRNA maturation RNase YbeY [Woeseiaceae bacterium]